VSWYEEHLWKISLQTNKYAKSYHMGVYTRQSTLGIFNWMTHTCFVPHLVHLHVWHIYGSFSTEGVNICTESDACPLSRIKNMVNKLVKYSIFSTFKTFTATVRYIFILWAPALSTICAPLCNSITHQSIVLESCSNPQKTRQVFLSI